MDLRGALDWPGTARPAPGEVLVSPMATIPAAVSNERFVPGGAYDLKRLPGPAKQSAVHAC